MHPIDIHRQVPYSLNVIVGMSDESRFSFARLREQCLVGGTVSPYLHKLVGLALSASKPSKVICLPCKQECQVTRANN